MVTETPPAEKPVEEVGPRGVTSSSVVVWIVYALGIFAATVLAASLAYVVVAYLISGDGGFGVDVSLTALVVWIVLLGMAAGTFAVRRWGGPR